MKTGYLPIHYRVSVTCPECGYAMTCQSAATERDAQDLAPQLSERSLLMCINCGEIMTGLPREPGKPFAVAALSEEQFLSLPPENQVQLCQMQQAHSELARKETGTRYLITVPGQEAR